MRFRRLLLMPAVDLADVAWPLCSCSLFPLPFTIPVSPGSQLVCLAPRSLVIAAEAYACVSESGRLLADQWDRAQLI